MYKAPSRRRSRKGITNPNVTPILDAVFIFIFFLLMSASFMKLYEISSDVPIISDRQPPPSKKPPLALTLKIVEGGLEVHSGVPSSRMRTFPADQEGGHDLDGLKAFLIDVKKRHPLENSIVLEPEIDIEYIKLVDIMDAVRMLDDMDEAIYYKDKDGLDARAEHLFANIVFGNIQS